ncbi:MAG: hypothetical protein EA376_08400 [Phycisphaeraceae bacterium]|nr:MAG: hypothetical protein EA376_08400 [Phycisphaeraceae bacterium]
MFCASFASAGVIVPTLQMELQQGGQTIWMIEPAGVPSDSGDNTFAYGGQWNNSDVEILYEVEASPGPASSGQRGSQLAFINASTDVTNNSMMTQHFTVIANLPVVGPIIPAVMGGSAQGGMTAGPNAPATLSSVAGSSIYAGLIDLMIASGSELFPHLTSITVMDPFESDSLGSMSFGTPIPSAPAPDVLTSIGIRFDFALDPGATATLSGVFAVNIPTPASLALFGAAGIFAARRRRA